MRNKFINGVLFVVLMCVFLTLFLTYGAEKEEPLKIGVLSFNEKNDTLEKWTPLADYLSVSLDRYTFVVIPLFYEEMDQAVLDGKLDFIFTNPGHFVELKTKHHLSGAIATLIEKDGKSIQYKFGGVIFTKSTNDLIGSLNDLKGKTISAVSKNSLGGYQAQAFELYKENFDLNNDVSFIFTGMPHSNAVQKVLNGEVDAGFVRTGVLEKMALEGHINLEDLKIIQSHVYPNFNYLISTALYPEWPFAAASHVDTNTSRTVASRLLMLAPDDKHAQNIGIHGFNIPSNYLGVEEMMRALRLYPFDQDVSMTLEQVWDRYRFYIVGAVIAMILLLTGLMFKSYSERKIKKINRRLNKTMLALEQSHEKIKCLFNNMHDGFALHEIVFDDNGKAIDYKFLDINNAFEKITGLSREKIIGKTVKEVLPTTEQSWIEHYADVAMNGTALSFSKYSIALDKYFHVNVYSTTKNQFVTVFYDITVEIKAKEKTAQEKKLLERILEDTLSGYWDWNLVDNTEYLSPSFKAMFGYEDNEMENSPESWQEIIYKEDLTQSLEQFKKHVESKGEVVFYNEVRYHHKDGSTVWVIYSGRVIEWEREKPLRMVGCHINITPIKQLEKQLKEEKELFKTTLYSIGDGVISTDAKGNIDIMNAVAEKLTGWSNEEAKGLAFQTIFKIISEFTRSPCDNPVEKVLKSGDFVELGDNTILIKKNNEEIPIEDIATPIRDDNGHMNGVVVVFRDATEKKEKQERIKYLSYHDQLTGLYNRHFFEEELKRLDVARNLPLSVVMVDVNGLKLVNDAFGHEAGDLLLQSVSNCLMKECRTDDIIARIGGDEFVILLPKTTFEDTEVIVKRIYKAIEHEKMNQVVVAVSLGWETKTAVEQDVKEVLSNAEDHMYRKKITESQSMRNKTIKVILQNLNESNEREKIHSEKVSEISRTIAASLNLDNETLKEVKLTGLMHDIGKIAISKEILNKPEPLSEHEFDEVKIHPEIGYQILKSADVYTRLAEYVLSHHERWNGKGYPRGLSGEEIPLVARIITVADAYEAMTSERPYKKLRTPEQALEEIKRCSGTQFDPAVVLAFEKTFI